MVASEQRVRRLGTLVQLRRCYQNVLYAELLLSQSSPIYQPLTAGALTWSTSWIRHVQCALTERTAELTEEEVQSEQDALLMVAVEIIGEMLLTVSDLEVRCHRVVGWSLFCTCHTKWLFE